jgi:type IV secretory pathway TraG/TraD family ATPase VirD4
MVVYIGLSSLLLGEHANRIGRAILQDFAGFLGEQYAYHDVQATPPVTMMIDEVGDVVYPLFINALNKGGGANARFILAQQSLSDIEAALGKAQAHRILDNCNTRIYFRLVDNDTASHVSEGLDTADVAVPETHVGVHYGGVGGLAGSAQRGMHHKDAWLLRSGWLKALPRGQAFVVCQGELFKLRVPRLAPVSDMVRQMLGLDALWTGLLP